MARPYSSIEGYRIVRELHRGGQGVVYEAVQESTKRKVAVKLLLGGQYAPTAARKRFEREIDLVAQLKHPNIITVFDSGFTSDGQQYCVMDYVCGRPLQEQVRERRLALEETLQLFATICRAVQYAHQRGVMHRDLKPSNILVDAEGSPKVLDFGLAKMLADPDRTVVTTTQEVIGTLPYMSPEQARGNSDEIDTRTDVYALGVILYELLTGHFPYPVGGQLPEVLRHITETAPIPPTRQWSRGSGVLRRSAKRLRPGECPIDNDVETIILKALAKERERRYQSAGELARDIEHYLAGEPIEAKRDRGWYLLSKAVRRYRARIAVTAVAVLLVIFSAFQLLARHRERAARVTAERRSLLLEADSRLNAGDYEGALQAARGILEDAPRELEASLVQARALVNLGREQEAYDELVELRSVHPGQAAVYELLAEIGTRSDPDQSRRYLSTARQLRKADSPQDHYLRSLASMDDREAIRLLTETLERDPGHFAALMARAVRYYRTRNFEGMRIDAERARTLRPDDWRAWYNLGTALYRLQSHEEALTALERSLGLNPNYASAWYNLGMAARSDDDPQRALAAFGRAVELDPRHPRALYQLGKVLHGMKEFSEAREAFEGAVTVDRDFFGSYYYLGLCHEALGDYAAALEAYDSCLDLKGAPRGTVLVGIGRARKSLGNTREALAAYARAITEAEDHADAQAYVSALNDSAWLYLTAPSAAVRDYERALAMARKAAEASPTPDARILGTLALAELRAGDYTAARRFARQALERDGESIWDLLVCARAELELGNVDEARRLWDRLRALLPGEEILDQTLRAFWAESKQRFTKALPEEYP